MTALLERNRRGRPNGDRRGATRADQADRPDPQAISSICIMARFGCG
jgi:hypothetical protein